MVSIRCAKCGQNFDCDENACPIIQELGKEIDQLKNKVNNLDSERRRAWMVYHMR